MCRRRRAGFKDILQHMVEETRTERAREREEAEAAAGTAADEQVEAAPPNQEVASAPTTTADPAREPLPHPPEDELYRNEEELKNFLDECEEWIRDW
ncbi:unnamed protein product [Durusdinium trenchii]